MDILSSLLQRLPSPDLRPKDLREFQEAVYKALEDGKLTDEEIEHLEGIREKYGLSEDALTDIRQELYRAALDVVKKQSELEEDTWHHMEHIQDYLGLEDQDIHLEKKELRRIIILNEIQQGSLPIQSDIEYSSKEPVHWMEPVIIYEPTKEKTEAISLGKGRSVRTGDVHADNLRGWKKEGGGELIITSRHVMIKRSNDSDVLTFRRIADAECYPSGIRLFVTRQHPIILLFKERGNQDIIASILFSLLGQ